LAELRRSHGNSDGSGARPFAALPNLILHHLTFIEFFEGRFFDLRMMEEQVVPIPLDEPKTSIRYQPLDFTLWHFCSPSKNPGDTAALAVRQTVAPKKKADKAAKNRS